MNANTHKIKIPIISITTMDEEEDDEGKVYNLTEFLTDVEELGDSNIENSSAKIKLKKRRVKSYRMDKSLTDTEDMYVSDNEDIKTKPVFQSTSLHLSKVSGFENEIMEEKCKISSKVSKGKKKIHTQSSTKTEKKSITVKENYKHFDCTFTDYEEFEASEEDIPSTEVPDYDFCPDFLNTSQEVKITDELCTAASYKITPSVTPTVLSTTNDSNKFYHNLDVEQLNNIDYLTDTEILQETTVERKHKKLSKKSYQNRDEKCAFVDYLSTKNLQINKTNDILVKRKSLPVLDKFGAKSKMLSESNNFSLMKQRSLSVSNVISLHNCNTSGCKSNEHETDTEDFSDVDISGYTTSDLNKIIGKRGTKPIKSNCGINIVPRLTLEPTTDIEELSNIEGSEVNKNQSNVKEIFSLRRNINYDTEELIDTDGISTTDDESSAENTKRVEVLFNSPPRSQRTEGKMYSEVSVFFKTKKGNCCEEELPSKLSSLSLLTDNEDFLTSADEETVCYRTQIFTPTDLCNELDENIISKVHNQNKKRMDFYSPSEIAYLRCNVYQEVLTDMEDLNSSDDERQIKKKVASKIFEKEEWDGEPQQAQCQSLEIQKGQQGEPVEQLQDVAAAIPETSVYPSRAQGYQRRLLKYDISIDDQTEVDLREHDWRFNLHQYGGEDKEDNESKTKRERSVQDQHKLSEEMEELLEAMKDASKK